MATDEPDMVNHPPHYTSHPSGVECIDIVRHMNFNLGNVVKYVWRSGLKGDGVTIQDLEKAAWYLHDEIEMRKREAEGAKKTLLNRVGD
jgi:Protein of unknwon function (DUF3310)